MEIELPEIDVVTPQSCNCGCSKGAGGGGGADE